MAAVSPLGRLHGRVPRTLVAAIKELVGRGCRIVEVDAGTGVLTGALDRAGCDVVAIESDHDRLTQLRRSLPGVPVVRAGSSTLPLRTGSVATLVIHWPVARMDARLLSSEIDRVTAAGSVVMVLRRGVVHSGSKGGVGTPGRAWSTHPDDTPEPDPIIDGIRSHCYEGARGEVDMSMTVWSMPVGQDSGEEVDDHRVDLFGFLEMQEVSGAGNHHGPAPLDGQETADGGRHPG